MKLTIEGRDFELKANGYLMKKYQEKFKETLVMAIYKVTTEKDMLACAKIIYCAADVEESFDEWLTSFKSPLFTLDYMTDVINFIVDGTEPTVKPMKTNDDKKDVKKKKN